ncbi:hypothetical protein [Cumulibacter manganitolerans]|uniref:hypothetical protein n=1 Tax=Cumulibacter manganitolerans TaxID=1884992 RepID=UPI0012980338|nr:hypothetical protein [Cumulibacter manganitolerans]
MKTRSIAAVLAAATIALTAGCSDATAEEGSTRSSVAASASADASHPESSGASESGSAESSSAAPTDANGREILPSQEPDGFGLSDASSPFKYGVIVGYVNKYPGWIVLSTEEPAYDAQEGGYRVNVYFNGEGGSDIILRDEFTMIVDGQTYHPEPLEPTGEGGTTDWLAGKTPIGNRPDATRNYAFGDLLFKIPQTQSPLEMHYDNKDGDVHITWNPNGKGY